MDLSEKGICILEQIIEKRFNEKTIDKHAQCGCSNSCEGFWGQLIRLSKGKRIQGCGTDLWLSMVHLCFCMNGKGNVEKTREDLSRLVNVFFTSVEREEGNTNVEAYYSYASLVLTKGAYEYYGSTVRLFSGMYPVLYN